MFSYHHVANSASPVRFQFDSKFEDNVPVYFDSVFYDATPGTQVVVKKFGFTAMGDTNDTGWLNIDTVWNSFNGNALSLEILTGQSSKWLTDTGLITGSTMINTLSEVNIGYSHLMMQFEVKGGSVSFKIGRVSCRERV